MQHTTSLRLLLAACGFVAAGIGATILFAPAAFHATHGIDLGSDPSLLSEVRAPGGALFALGGLIFAGAIVPSLAMLSTSVSAAVYLAYGASRLISLALDGLPESGLIGATAIELALGSACALVLLRSHSRTHRSTRSNARPSPSARRPSPVAGACR